MKRLMGGEEEDRGKRVRNEAPQEPTKTVYLGSLESSVTLPEICDIVSGGPVEAVRVIPRKHCAFVSFLDIDSAIAFHKECSKEPPVFHGRKATVGWASSNPLEQDIQKAIQEGATRNVYLGGISGERMSESWLRAALSAFGEIDCIDVLVAKRIAFVHFGSIVSAVHCVQTLSQDSLWQTCKIGYGKDRSAGPGRRRRMAERPPPPRFAPEFRDDFRESGLRDYDRDVRDSRGLRDPRDFRDVREYREPRDYRDPRDFRDSRDARDTRDARDPRDSRDLRDSRDFRDYRDHRDAPPRDPGSRTIYLGGAIDEEAAKDLFDYAWGGVLEEIKVLPEKKCAFVSFLEARDAEYFMSRNSRGDLLIRGHNFKVGWGKVRQLHRDIIRAVREQNATRNVFLGNVDDSLTVQHLEEDLSKFGPIEKINLIPAKKIAFVNFTNIMHAINCVKELKDESSTLFQKNYGKYRISYGKDRCAREYRERELPRPRTPRYDNSHEDPYATY